MASGNSGIIFSYIPLLLSKESIRSEREGLKMEVMVETVELAMLYSERHVTLCHIKHIVALKALHTSVKHGVMGLCRQMLSGRKRRASNMADRPLDIVSAP